MKFLKRSFALLMLTLPLFGGITLAQDDVQIKATQVAEGIHMLMGKGGNIGVLVGPDGTFVIDDQFAPLSKKIQTAIKDLGGDDPRFLINTHFHGDHTGGNENFGRLGTTIVSHDNVRERLKNGSFIQAFGMNSAPAPDKALPVITFSEEMHFHINGETVKAIHAAQAHTDGDSFIHFENANVIHAGDLFFNGFYPFMDAANGGSLKGLIKAADQILALSNDKTKIIPGHGPLADKAQLKAYRDMLATAYDRLIQLKNEGVSAEDAVVQGPLDDLDEQWGGGIFTADRWIQIIYPGVY